MSHYSTQKKNASWYLFLGCFLCVIALSCDGKSPTPPNGQNKWVTANNGLESLFIQFLTVHPTISNLIFVGTWDGLYKSTDGGQSWVRKDSAWAYTQVSAIAFDSQDAEVMYVGTQGGGIYKSEDGGESWEMRNYGLGDPSVYSIVTDPQKSDTLFVGTENGIYRSYDGADSLAQIYWLPRSFLAIDSENSQTIYVGGKWNNFRKSQDGGTSWPDGQPEGLPGGGPAVKIQWILIDPDNPRTLYAASSNYGIYKSTNSGLNWTESNTGLWVLDVRALALDAFEAVLYAATNQGVSRSSDGAETWQKMNEGFANLDIKSLALGSHRLYAGTWGDGVFVWQTTR